MFDSPEILSTININGPRDHSRHPNTFYIKIPSTRLYQNEPLGKCCLNYMSIQGEIDIFQCNINKIKRCFT